MAKAGGAWRVCINLIGLNKAIPKKPHPLPVIDQLVDSVAGHKLLSFLDAYKGYYQIPMAKEDMAKTTFVTDDGIYYYTRMLVWLKKCWSGLPGGLNKAFEGLTGKIVKFYVNYIIVKSKKK